MTKNKSSRNRPPVANEVKSTPKTHMAVIPEPFVSLEAAAVSLWLMLQEGGGAGAQPKRLSGVPGAGYEFGNLGIRGAVSRHWLHAADLPEDRNSDWEHALGHLRTALRLLDYAGVLTDIQEQLAQDSKKLGQNLKLDVKFEIQEDNSWKKAGKDGIVFAGNPTKIFINLELLDDLEAALKVLIQFLLLAKHKTYLDAGTASPYPKGEDDPEFQKKERELLRKLTVIPGGSDLPPRPGYI